MNQTGADEKEQDALIEEITVDAYGDEEQLWAFRQVLEDEVALPADAFVIGELSLGEGFDGVLPWGHIDNRPFLRCKHGYGVCLWRLGRFEGAWQVIDRMLWLNPSDNQGARFLVDQVKAGRHPSTSTAVGLALRSAH